jgi:hypothetical protein
MASLHPAGQRLEVQMHDVDVESVESRRVVQVHSDIFKIKSKFVLQNTTD